MLLELCLQTQQRQGAQLVNDPRAWAMSALSTGDPDFCRTFYGEVFGWETDTFDNGTAEVTLWRLPGYVGGEPQQPAPRDVVAVMASLNNGSPPHWSVDFCVDDADATATRAVELGGFVLAGPFDIPRFRCAVFKDPQGAVLSISKLRR